MYTAESNPRIFEYDNYRRFLRDYYDARKAADPRFSHRYLARAAGFRSPNFVQLVINGKRNLSAESADKLCRALKLDRKEARYFQDLVFFNQAGSLQEKRFFAEQLLSSKMYRNLNPLKGAQFAYYANWYMIPIRELAACPDFHDDPEWIAKRLDPTISPAEARKALEDLERLGLLKRDARGRLHQSEASVTTGDEVTSSSVMQFQREMIDRSGEALERIPREKRDISSLTVGVSAQGARQIKDLLQRFRKELLAIASQEESPEAVYQLNFQFFPLTSEAPVLTDEAPNSDEASDSAEKAAKGRKEAG